jgi:hypothetical protein
MEPQRLRKLIFITENQCFGGPEAQKTNFYSRKDMLWSPKGSEPNFD